MPGNLQTTIRTPNILVPPSDEDRLPDSQVLLGTTSLPFGKTQSNRSECPGRFLSPSREILGFLFAAFVIVAPLPFLAESSRHRLVAMNDTRTGATVDHFSESIMKGASAGYQSSVTLDLRLEIDELEELQSI